MAKQPNKVTIKFKDEVSGTINKLSDNNEKIVALLKSNNELMLKVLKLSFEVV